MDEIASTVQQPATVAAQRASALKPILNVWGFKSPLTAGSTFKADVRVKVRDARSLEGASIKVVDPSTGKVLASSRMGSAADSEAGMLQDVVELPVPATPGLHKYTAVLEDGSDQIPAQVVIPFSAVPAPDREVKVVCKDDRSGKPLKARLFFYNADLPKTKPVDFRANEDGVAAAKIVSGAKYRVEAVCEDYVAAFLDIPADAEKNEFELPMRYVFNVKMKKAF